jgi:hypothetical protein
MALSDGAQRQCKISTYMKVVALWLYWADGYTYRIEHFSLDSLMYLKNDEHANTTYCMTAGW